ncbi:hypothetical protein [Acidovorax sp. SUPP3334]|uniref:hypothetical protein n=1 Tax=Acidovorax sp. SUPP3334 TaxID=2920881 RepID=UPI0024E0E6F7|nr:hypothetical protein [Acidovorax sp. SUPP3334]
MLPCRPNSRVMVICAFTSSLTRFLSKMGLIPVSASPVRASALPATPEIPARLVLCAFPLSLPTPAPLLPNWLPTPTVTSNPLAL